MKAPAYNIEVGSEHDKFDRCRTTVQLFGGGFGNGKTAAATVLKVLKVAQGYPGANILAARATYPKLNDTIRKEFYKWCPAGWIERRHVKDDNTVILKNGTHVNFRYVQQQGQTKSSGETTSNLLSTTYDLIVVDQMEDPEFSKKDFVDLMGRRRGQTAYVGDDPTMPRVGPGWIIITCNPTRNWVFTDLVRPIEETQRTGIKHPDLLVDEDSGEAIIEYFGGPTSINAANLPKDYISGMKAVMTDSTFRRMVGGEWLGYEGLVYADWNREIHMLPREHIIAYMHELMRSGYRIVYREGYDFGVAEPSCYGLWFFDHLHNAFLVDGFYQKEFDIPDQITAIHEMRMRYGFVPNADHAVWADPSIFRRFMRTRIVGQTVAGMFQEGGISMQRGNNAIINGIIKVQGYIRPQDARAHPIYRTTPGARLYVADELQWYGDEIEDYYWKKTPDGQPTDEPTDRNNHALDMTRYVFTEQPPVLGVTGVFGPQLPPWRKWHEVQEARKPRTRHLALGVR